VYSRVDQQRTGMSPHDHRNALEEVVPVYQYVFGALRQQLSPLPTYAFYVSPIRV
jgi:hypothetical protein